MRHQSEPCRRGEEAGHKYSLLVPIHKRMNRLKANGSRGDSKGAVPTLVMLLTTDNFSICFFQF